MIHFFQNKVLIPFISLEIDNSFPFICKIFGETQNKDIVLEYIEGETLEKFITTRPNIEFKVKMKIIIQILFAILYSHSQGFFLRDIKSDNIIIDLLENAILIDFNYSKKTVTQLLMKLKQTNVYFSYFYQNLRYGGDTSYDIPYTHFKSVIQKAKEEYSCEDETMIPNTNK